MVGCGSVALESHIPAFLELSEQFQVVAIADPTSSSRKRAQELLGLADADAYSTHEALLTRTDIEVIDVCTPPSTHREIVVAAAHEHKHVLCEKPLAIVPRDAAEMVRAARSAGITLGLVHNYLFMPEFVAARSIIDSGEIGAVEVAILNYLGVVDNPGSDVYQPDWRHRPAIAGGGVLVDMLHGVYVAEFLLGGTIRRVSAYVDAREYGSPVEDLALCRFESDTNVALVNIGWGVGPGGVELSGTEGRLVIRYRKEGTSPFFPLEQMTVVGRLGERVEAVVERRDDHHLALLDFRAAVLERREPVASGEDGQRMLEAVLAVYESALLERPVSLPLDTDDPVFQLGVAGLVQLPATPESRPMRTGIFGLDIARSHDGADSVTLTKGREAEPDGTDRL